MKQREYPCITLTYSPVAASYHLVFHKSVGQYFLIEWSIDYKPMAERGLKNSFEIKVPFYNEVQP